MRVDEQLKLKGQIAFVSGAARGLGFAMAEAVAEQGAHVVMTDIDADALASAADRLRAAGGAVETIVLDVSDLDAITRAIDGIVAAHGQIDIVFANAGLSAGSGPRTEAGAMANVDLARWNALLNINLTSVFVTIRSAAAHMIKRRQGRIIVTSSIAGLRGEPMCGYAYASTKAAVANLVRQSVIELAPHNVNINAIAPGPFLTDIGQGRLRDPHVASQFVADVPLGRLGSPHEIKGLALLLASPASSFMTGAVIPIDGGASAY
ncbi:SDR family NAD(P)-dependent oxidoreductase [Bosea massiliensis]|uniref:SDR family NAD(P)-dependent oxidoreductase n=1 Tax=Bosea massiliensis TaxID=151419 RepID=A0ABW0P607_9HYPH